ncbi:MAG: hypothetical protein OWU32_12810, partial [Firmicutes bacterium]|nr:hypothetical protein [Bacillota bacterium]
MLEWTPIFLLTSARDGSGLRSRFRWSLELFWSWFGAISEPLQRYFAAAFKPGSSRVQATGHGIYKLTGGLHTMKSDKRTDAMGSKKPAKKPMTKARRRRRIAIASTIAAVVVIGLGAGAALGGQAFTTFIPAIAPFIIGTQLTQPENILLIGNNARNPVTPISLGTGGGQADIMMIAHIDPIKHQVVLISLPRDCLFAMPQYSDPIPKLKSFFFIGAQMNPNQA